MMIAFLIGDSFFDSSILELANLEFPVSHPSSSQVNLDKFVTSNKNKFNILHLNINFILGLEKRLGLDSILVSEKFDCY